MTSHPGKQTITISILSDISKNKSIEEMKVNHLTECQVKNIFFAKIM